MAARRRLSRDETRARTREQLLDAARSLFARSGYAGASVDAIAAEAGFTKGAFYSNFESKEAIFLELLAQHMQTQAAQLDRLVSEADSAQDVLDGLDAWLGEMHADADWPLLALELQLHARRTPSFAKRYDALNTDHQRRLGALIERLFALSNRTLEVPSADVAAALKALAHGLAIRRRRPTKGPDPAGRMVSHVLRSLLAAAPRR